MIFVLFNQANEVVGAANGVTEAHASGNRYESRWDWKSLEQVQGLAKQLSDATGDLYHGQDKGANVRPRFDIYKAPAVGDEVSMTFNGDYYHCGKIVSISTSMRKIVTANGTTFWRRGHGALWLNLGTFAMIPGVHNERNPHF